MNIQRNEWTVFSIYQRHSPSISFADRSSNDLEDRDGNRIRHEVERKKNRRMRYRVLPTRREEGETFTRKKDVFEGEKERGENKDRSRRVGNASRKLATSRN